MREKALQKRLSRHPGCQSHEQTTLLRPRHFLISRSWFLSVLLKSGDFSFASLTNRLSLLLTISPGHVGDAHIKPLRDCVITSAEALSPLIYNCRTRNPDELHLATSLDCSVLPLSRQTPPPFF